MARQKKPVHRVEMTEGKRNIIRQLLEGIRYRNSRGYPGCSERSLYRNSININKSIHYCIDLLIFN